MAPIDDLGTQRPSDVPYSINSSSAAAARNISLSFIQALGFGAPHGHYRPHATLLDLSPDPMHIAASFLIVHHTAWLRIRRPPAHGLCYLSSRRAVRTRNNTTSAHRYYIGVSPFDAEVFVAPLLYMYPPPEVGGLGLRDRRGAQLIRVILGREGGNTAMYRVGSPTRYAPFRHSLDSSKPDSDGDSDDRYKESLAKNAESSAAAADKTQVRIREMLWIAHGSDGGHCQPDTYGFTSWKRNTPQPTLQVLTACVLCGRHRREGDAQYQPLQT
ncbi:hypothetical protein C8J57DRAFT_1483596 [Mycena rebaudengoi]|nr:hypothetical protein C8J57DRAFT_1483596 [Mycena rebaudengoi]